jgi:hypothetical protein
MGALMKAPTWEDLQNRLGTVDSIDLLRSGQLVVNIGDSIQVLTTEGAQTPSSSEHTISHVYPLDNGKAICASSWNLMEVYVLDMETTKTLFRHSIGSNSSDRSFTPRLLCASIDRRIAVLSFLKGPRFAVELHVLDDLWRCRWGALLLRPVSRCTIT